MNKRILIHLCLFNEVLAIYHGSESQVIEAFIMDIIQTWQLQSPTIIIKEDLPEICMKHQRLLCMSDHQSTIELANHLASVHQHRKQDSLIIVGHQGLENLVTYLTENTPSVWTSNYPVFMPTSYKSDIKLRLDSNIVFYSESEVGIYELFDIFSVKAGPSIEIEVGQWSVSTGMTLMSSMNRWDRRTNLQQTTFVNCFTYNGEMANFTRDENGTIVGSEGYFQEILFYVTDKLNMTIEIMAAPWHMQLLDNGSWTGEIGFLQRQEVDVVSSGLGLRLQRSYFIDYPIPTLRGRLTLLAPIPKGVAPNMWVYINIFGVYQWLLFLVSLFLMAMGLSVTHALSNDLSGRGFATKRGSNKSYKLSSASSALSLVYLYTLQMGSHTNSKKLTPRLLTLTTSTLTLLFFAFYTTDITAKMTSGPSDTPIRTFEDVIHKNYEVITNNNYFESILASSKPGSAKLQVYNNNFVKFRRERPFHAYDIVLQDPDSKILMYANADWIASRKPSGEKVADHLKALKMDDSLYIMAGLTLQKDSEFLQIFNYYTLKAMECGLIKRQHLNHTAELHTNENFEMMEPQPLGMNNVMFCFISLGFGICVSLIKVLMEFMGNKIFKNQVTAKYNDRGDKARWATIRGERNEREIEREGREGETDMKEGVRK